MLIAILVIVVTSFWSSVVLGKKMAGNIEEPMIALADRLQTFAQGDLNSAFRTETFKMRYPARYRSQR